jgi:hypothetical protein
MTGATGSAVPPLTFTLGPLLPLDHRRHCGAVHPTRPARPKEHEKPTDSPESMRYLVLKPPPPPSSCSYTFRNEIKVSSGVPFSSFLENNEEIICDRTSSRLGGLAPGPDILRGAGEVDGGCRVGD